MNAADARNLRRFSRSLAREGTEDTAECRRHIEALLMNRNNRHAMLYFAGPAAVAVAEYSRKQASS